MWRRRLVRAALVTIALAAASIAFVRARAPDYVEGRAEAALRQLGFPDARLELVDLSWGRIELADVDLGAGARAERVVLELSLGDLRRRRVDTITVIGAELRARELASHLAALRSQRRDSGRPWRLPFRRAVVQRSRVIAGDRVLPLAGQVEAREHGAALALSTRLGAAAATLDAELSRDGDGYQVDATVAAQGPARGDRLRARLRYTGGRLSADAELAWASATALAGAQPLALRDLRASARVELAGGRVTRAELDATAAAAEHGARSLQGLTAELVATGTASTAAFDLEVDTTVTARRGRAGERRADRLRGRWRGQLAGDRAGLDSAAGTLELAARQLRVGELRARRLELRVPLAADTALAGTAAAAGLWWRDHRLGSARARWRWGRAGLALDLDARPASDIVDKARARLRVARSGAIAVDELELAAFGGQLRARDLRIDRRRRRAEAAIAARGLDLRQLVPRISRGRADGRGRVDGELMLALAWGRRPDLHVERAHLRAPTGGRIVIRDRGTLARLVAAADDEHIRGLGGRLAAALADFRFSQLTLDLPPRRPRLVRLHLQGHGRRVDQEFDLTVNLRGLGRVAERALDLWLAAQAPTTSQGAST